MKALELDHALDGEVMIAYAMNGEDLPWLNGFPIRLVVPGYYGTYWVKHLSTINVLDAPLDSFWMKTAYRIPNNACACTPPGKAPASTVPIGRFNVRSFLTNIADGETVPANKDVGLRGIAFDGGQGISDVAVSADSGKTWIEATLGDDLGPYSFREWKANRHARARQIRPDGSRRQSRRPVAAARAALEPGRLYAQCRRSDERDRCVRRRPMMPLVTVAYAALFVLASPASPIRSSISCPTRRRSSSRARASKPRSSARRVIPPITSAPSRPERARRSGRPRCKR